MSHAAVPAGPGDDAFTVIGVDIGGTKIEVALADAHGAVLTRERLETRAALGPDQALARTAEAVRRLGKVAVDVHGLPVAAWAAGCPGVIQRDRILLTPNLPGWETLALADRLAEEFGVAQVQVSNDVRAGALAEARFGALRAVDTGMYVSLGTGIAGALVVHGRVLSGANQASGEMGYMNPGMAPLDSVAAGCAPLEEVVGGRWLGGRAALLAGEPSSEQLFRRTDPEARELVNETLRVLAMALANLAVFVDPSRIVLGGGMMAAAETILPTLAELVSGATPFPPEIVAARFLKDASLHGAVALALDGAHAAAAGAQQTSTSTSTDAPNLVHVPRPDLRRTPGGPR